MSYLHIDNLYKSQDILLFKEVYALEKIHGTSAHVAWKDGVIRFFAGGCSHDLFVSLFNKDELFTKLTALGHPEVIIFGEQYGGKQQGMSKRYGKQAKFIAFDVKVDKMWLSVPDAESVATAIGLEFVHFALVPAIIAALDAERDSPSVQAKRNGILDDQPREGIVIHPKIELTKNNGERIIAKHKREEERETRTQREVTPEVLAVLTEANEIAREWVTPTRLTHVIDALKSKGFMITGMEHTKEVIHAMIEDVTREGAGEIVDSKEARAAIGQKCAILFKKKLQEALQNTGA